jgi:hypothetical protein
MRQIGQHRRAAMDRSKYFVWFSWAVLLIAPHSADASAPVAGLVAGGVVGQSQTGTIKGRLIWGDENIPPAKVLVEKGKGGNDADICAKDEAIVSRSLVIDPKTKGVAYAFAYLVKPKGDFAQATRDLVAKQPKVMLDQKSCEFQPYLLPLHKDQTLVIKSSDPKTHNVRFAGFQNTGINKSVAPMGQFEVQLVPDRVPLELHCDIHTWMKGYLMVFDHPFFTTTGPDGSFEIKGIPAGDQNLIVWQEKAGYATPGRSGGLAVSVKAGEVTDVGLIKIDPAKVDK